jgi:methanogenic corrinoid protein MtbC1
LSQEKEITRLIEKAKSSVLNFDEIAAENVARDTLKMGLDTTEIIEKGFLEGMKAMGDLFEEGDVCLLHIFAASNAMNAGIATLNDYKSDKKTNENMVIERINEGGKDEKIDILETMFKINGYDVVEIPDDVPIVDFIEKDRGFIDIPDSCKEEIKATIAANPRVSTFQLCDMTGNITC